MIRSFARGPKRVLALLGSISVTVVLAVAVLAPSVAVGQATRTWVSGVGDDVNPCSRTAPCKTFPGAISKTAAGGEINCMDPGGFGAVTITKAITIKCVGVLGGLLVSGTPAITVNAASTDEIIIDGLDIEGVGTGTNGINIVSASSVIIRNTTIHHFTTGVNVDGPAGAKVSIENSYINQNAVGVNVQGTSGAANTAVIDQTTIEANTTAAIQVQQGGAAFLSASSLVGAGPKIVYVGNGTLTSYGNNVIRGAGSNPTTTLPLQ